MRNAKRTIGLVGGDMNECEWVAKSLGGKLKHKKDKQAIYENDIFIFECRTISKGGTPNWDGIIYCGDVSANVIDDWNMALYYDTKHKTE